MPAHETVIGFDLGGTKSAVALYDTKTWKVLKREQSKTNAKIGLEGVLNECVAMIEKLKQSDTVAVGMGLPGLLARDDGRVLAMPNIPGGTDFPAKRLLAKALGLPVAVSNDAQCFTLAEARMGAGKDLPVVIGVTMGTGVGGGIVIDGKLLRGARGAAGEVGHMLLRPGEPPFPTMDKRGEVEQFLSGTALGKRCEAASRPEDYLEGQVCSFLRPEVFRETAWLVASLWSLLDPSIVIFGGSTGCALKPHFPEIEAELKTWMLPNAVMPKLAIGVREDAGTLGAALLTTDA